MRLDQFLVLHMGIESRTKAQSLIQNNLVFLKLEAQNKILNKSSFSILDHEIEHYKKTIFIEESDLQKYVSRAAIKLKKAFEHLKIDCQNQIVLDVGQSTGGFTECCLQFGAKQVVGFDVGQGQLHESLKHHQKVIYFEELNAKDLSQHKFFKDKFNYFDLVVCDVSFISLKKFFEKIVPYLKHEGTFLVLVKPQFECGPQHLDKNGIVKDSNIYKTIETEIVQFFSEIFNTHEINFFESELVGKDGNKEYFIYGHKK